MPSCITEIFTDCSTCKGSIIPQSSCICSCSSHNYGIIHSSLLLQCSHEGCNCRSLLTDGHINTEHRLTGLISSALIDDGVYSNCCLSCLTVTNYELTLAPADRDHGINSLQTCLQRLCNRLTENNARSLTFQRHFHKVTTDRSLAIKRLSKRIHHSSDHLVGNIYRSDSSCSPDHHSFLDPVSRTKKHRTDIIFLKIHDYGLDAIFKLKKFSCLSIQQSMNSDHTITHLQDLADLLEMKAHIKVAQLFEQHIRYLTWAYLICHILSNYSIVIIYQSIPYTFELP